MSPQWIQRRLELQATLSALTLDSLENRRTIVIIKRQLSQVLPGFPIGNVTGYNGHNFD